MYNLLHSSLPFAVLSLPGYFYECLSDLVIPRWEAKVCGFAFGFTAIEEIDIIVVLNLLPH